MWSSLASIAVRGTAVPSRSQEHLHGEQPDLETCSLELLCYRGDGYSSQRKSLPFLRGYGCCAATHRTSVSGVLAARRVWTEVTVLWLQPKWRAVLLPLRRHGSSVGCLTGIPVVSSPFCKEL